MRKSSTKEEPVLSGIRTHSEFQPASNGRQTIPNSTANTKEEPSFTQPSKGARIKHSSKGLVFQQLQSTDIAPQVKQESEAKTEPKEEPLLQPRSKRGRLPKGDVILFDVGNSKNVITVPKKKKSVMQSLTGGSRLEIIVVDTSEDETVAKQTPSATEVTGVEDFRSAENKAVKRRRRSNSEAGNNDDDALYAGDTNARDAALPDKGHDMKESLGNFLRLISSSAQGEGGLSGLLNTARQTYKRAEQDGMKDNTEGAYPPRAQTISGEEQVKTESVLARVRIRQNPTKPSAGHEKQRQHSGVSIPPSTSGDENEIRPFNSNRVGVPTERTSWYPTPRTEQEQLHIESTKTQLNDGQDAAFREQGAAGDEPVIELRKGQDIRKSHPHLRKSVRSYPDSDDEDQIRPSVILSRDLNESIEPHFYDREEEMICSNQAEKRRRLEISHKEYIRAEPGQKRKGKRKRAEIEVSRQGHSDEGVAAKPMNEINSVELDLGARTITGEESDIDPDDMELQPGLGTKLTSPRSASKVNRDRAVRAQRRAAEAAGGDVHLSIMRDQKPDIPENNTNVIIKVREAQGKTLFTFVKGRDERFGHIREELQLLARVPRDLKFELRYKKRPVKDSDTANSLRILHTARFKAHRIVRPEDDSSDDVTEVEMQRRRKNLIKVTVQDEKGKKHSFQHDRKSKLGSMFQAFAKLCHNDVRSYRFFFDGQRLGHDDRPKDLEDFTDGSLIDAFFEAQGGR